MGLVILLLRPQDRNVWLLACFFAELRFGVRVPGRLTRLCRRRCGFGWSLYGGIFLGAIGASFYFLCAVFPARSPIDRRLPWLKWAALVFGLADAGEMSRPDVSRPVATLSRLIGPQAADQFDFGVTLRVSRARAGFAGRQLFLRRRTGIAPQDPRDLLGHRGRHRPFIDPRRAPSTTPVSSRRLGWNMILNALLLLVPASFAYAVFKQRVLDIPVLLRRSARYVLVQRGFLILLCFVSFGLDAVVRGVAGASAAGDRDGPLLEHRAGRAVRHGAAVGRVARSHAGEREDRPRFLSQRLRRPGHPGESGGNLAHWPPTARRWRTCFSTSSTQLSNRHRWWSIWRSTTTNWAPPPEWRRPIFKRFAALRRCSWNWPARASLGNCRRLVSRTDPKTAVLAPLHSGCLVPMLGRDGRLVGLLALGPRLSEEPYSGEDKRLLASVASQAGMALENFRLAEDIAEKLEAERRTTREMEIAKEVQTRLLPADRAGTCRRSNARGDVSRPRASAEITTTSSNWAATR